LARSCSRSELTAGWSGEPEHAAAAATSMAPIESRREFRMLGATPGGPKRAVGLLVESAIGSNARLGGPR
jgi:hypothetical protein